MGLSRPALAACFLLSCSYPARAAGSATLAADVNSSFIFNPDTRWRDFRTVGTRAVFSADERLWSSDGTAGGTQPLGAELGLERWLRVEGDVAVFVARERFGLPLWRTDGTPAGTIPLSAAGIEVDSDLLPTNGAAFFTARRRVGGDHHPIYQPSIWRTDGTAGGTRELLELPIGFIQAPAVLGDDLLFVYTPDTVTDETGPDDAPRELWKLEGSSGRATLVRRLGSESIAGGGALRGKYVVLTHTTRGRLWESDGRREGTRPLTALPAGTRISTGARVIGDHLVFQVVDAAGTTRVWTSDGTASGTRSLSSTASVPPDLFAPHLVPLPAAPGSFLFAGFEPGFGVEPWVSDGRPQGTRRLLDACPGPCDGIVDVSLSGAGTHTFYFSGSRGLGLPAVWSTDGTAAGTRLLRTLSDNSADCPPFFTSDVATVGDDVFFFACRLGTGVELLRAGADPASVRRMTSLPDSGALEASEPELGIARAGETLLFPAFDRLHGRELWATDGLPESTRFVTDLSPAEGTPSDPRGIVGVNGRAVFTACTGGRLGLYSSDGDPASLAALADLDLFCNDQLATAVVHGWAYVATPLGLWRSDGSGAGTELRIPVSSEPDGFPPRIFSEAPFGFGSRTLILAAETSPDGARRVRRLWEIDDSPAGGHALESIAELEEAATIRAANGSLFYFSILGVPPIQRTKAGISDSTAAGTRFLNIPAATRDPVFHPPGLAAAGDKTVLCCFPHGGALNLHGAWVSDGTDTGTLALTAANGFPRDFDLQAASSANLPNGDLLFVTQLNTLPEIWRTDGTPGGTQLVRRFEGSSDFGNFVRLGNEVFFTSQSFERGTRLWKSDGTQDGTLDVFSAPTNTLFVEGITLHSTGQRLFFVVTHPDFGSELWTSDGTPDGTRLAHDLWPGLRGSFPRDFGRVDSRLFFSAEDGIVGRELWSVGEAPEEDCRPTARALCLGGRYRAEIAWTRLDGEHGVGHAVPVGEDSGAFWFFNPASYDALVKVIDGSSLNGRAWVFFGGLSDTAYTLTVTDIETGAVARYQNLLGQSVSFGDTAAFDVARSAARLGDEPGFEVAPPLDLVTERRVQPRGGCLPNPRRLCLLGGRFALTARYETAPGQLAPATVIDGTDGTGLFWFRRADNVELGVKLVDGRGINDHFWIFAATLTDQGFEITVTDTTTGQERTYRGRRGNFASFSDTAAF